MEEFTKNGMTMRWSEALADAAGGFKRVLVEAGPAATPHDILRLVYSVDGGPERAVRGWPRGLDPQTGRHGYAADLPAIPAGKAMSWRPVLTSGGHEYDPGRKSSVPDKQPVKAESSAQAPRLEHIAAFVVPFVSNFYPTGETPDGVWLHFGIREGGHVRGARLNGTIIPVGGDWMRIRPDGVGILHAKALIEPDGGGGPIMFEDTGICDFGADGYASLAQGKLPASAPVRLAPRYLTSNPGYLWLNRLQGFAVGEASLSDITLCFDVYCAEGSPDG